MTEKHSQKKEYDFPLSQKRTHRPILEVQDLSFTYKTSGFKLQDISFTIYANDFLVLSGPNGSGKTTLVKVLLGVHKPKTGNVYFKHKKQSPRELIKKIGFVMQNPDDQIFFPEVYEDIAFGPRNQGLTDEQVHQRVIQALELLSITHLKNRTFTTLSFGEKKKVSIAGILAMQPDLIILDEPTLGFDPWSKTNFIKTLLSLQKSQTLFIITHDTELMKHATRILYLKQGKLVKEYSSYTTFKTEVLQANIN